LYKRLLWLGLVAVCLVPCASAAAFSFSGTFNTDDEFKLITFVAGANPVTLQTWSYAGGLDAAGNLIAAGGFAPVVTIYDATSGIGPSDPFVADQTSGAGCSTVAADPSSNGGCSDVLLPLLPETTLTPGDTYLVVLTQSGNTRSGGTFGDGFLEDGQGNYTPLFYGCSAAAFCDPNDPLDVRTGNWELDIVGATSADSGGSPVPEPSYGLPMLAAAAGGLLWRRLRQANA
jgi:hypothetical protein